MRKQHPAIKSVTFTPAVTAAGETVAARTQDAYSFDAFGEAEWAKAATMLLQRGMTEREAEAVLRSKHTRWSRDNAGKYEGTAEELGAYLDRYAITPKALAELVAETFAEE